MARAPYYCARQEGGSAQYKFSDWIVTLPKELEEKLVYEINDSEEEKKMPIITNAEKIDIEKGKIETVKKLLERGVGIKITAESTGLPKPGSNLWRRSRLKKPPDRFNAVRASLRHNDPAIRNSNNSKQRWRKINRVKASIAEAFSFYGYFLLKIWKYKPGVIYC